MTARLLENLGSRTAHRERPRRSWPISVLVHLLAIGALILLSHPAPQEPAEPARPAGPLSLQVVRAATRPPSMTPAAVRPRVRSTPTSTPPAQAPALTQAAPSTVPDGLPPIDSDAGDPVLPIGDGCPQGGCVAGGLPHAPDAGTPAGVSDGPPSGAPRVAGRDVTPPAKLHDVAPIYPVLAQRAGIAGAVVLACTIDVRGQVVDARVLSGPPMLSAAALAAVRQWRYRPTLVGGQPVAVLLTVTVHFHLRGR